MPSARPDRSGRRAVPVSWNRTDDQPRAARRGLRGVLHRRRAPRAGADTETAASQPGDSLMAIRREVATDLAARITVASLYTLLSINLLGDFLRTGHVTGLFLLASEFLVVVLTITRRPATLVDRS